MESRSRTSGATSTAGTYSPSTASPWVPTGSPAHASRTRSVRASSCSLADRTLSIRSIRTCSVIGPKGAGSSGGSGWRVGDHRRELAFGGDFAVEHRAARKLADAGALLEELDFETE